MVTHARRLLTGLIRGTLVVAVVIPFTVSAYAVTRLARSGLQPDALETGSRDSALLEDSVTLARRDSLRASKFPSGKHLIAYVMLSSECGFCTDRRVKEAVRVIRDTLQSTQGALYADVSVVGVLMEDLEKEFDYFEELSGSVSTPVFDQVMVGGSWLNEEIIRLVWQKAWAVPGVPQVIIVERHVDARLYPRNIDVQPDTMLLSIGGRSELLAWMSSGARLDFKPRR